MRTLKLAIFDYYPMVNDECIIPTWNCNRLCTLPGLGMELLKLLTDHLNWTIDATVKSMYDYDENHEDILNGTYDMYTMTFEKTQVREQIFDFSDELYESTSRLIVRRSENSLTNIFDFFAVYNWKTWLVMGLALCFFIAIGALTRWVEWKLSLRATTKVPELAWRMLRLQLIQYQGIEYRLMAGSFSLLVFAFLQVTIIISLYQSWIISSVVRTRTLYPFNLDDLPYLLKEKRYKFVSDDRNEWFMEEIDRNKESPFYDYKNNMDNDSFALVESEKEMLRLVNQGNAIAVEQDDIHLSFEVREWCDLIHMPSPFHQLKKYFMFNKGSPVVKDMNRAIKDNKMMIEKLHRKYVTYRRPSKCQQYSNLPQPLSLTPYYGVFILFLIGMTSACFVFGGELVSSICKINKVYPVQKVVDLA